MSATDPIPPAGPAAVETFEVQQLKAMEQPKWNEGRLDDLNKRVDDGIGRLDEERKELRGEMNEGFKAVEKRFDKVDEEFTAVRGEVKEGFEAVHRTIIQTTVAVLTAFIVGFGALVGLIATQLWIPPAAAPRWQADQKRRKLPEAQQGHEGVAFSQSGEGAGRKVGLSAEVKGLEYEWVGVCGKNLVRTGRVKSGASMLAAADEDGTQIGPWLAGEP